MGIPSQESLQQQPFKVLQRCRWRRTHLIHSADGAGRALGVVHIHLQGGGHRRCNLHRGGQWRTASRCAAFCGRWSNVERTSFHPSSSHQRLRHRILKARIFKSTLQLQLKPIKPLPAHGVWRLTMAPPLPHPAVPKPALLQRTVGN